MSPQHPVQQSTPKTSEEHHGSSRAEEVVGQTSSPNHVAGLNRRQQTILKMQKTHGNAAVRRFIEQGQIASIQRDPPSGSSGGLMNWWQDAELGRRVDDSSVSIDDVVTYVASLGERGAQVAAQDLQDARQTYSAGEGNPQKLARVNDVLRRIGLPGLIGDNFLWMNVALGAKIQDASISVDDIVAYLNGLDPAARQQAIETDLQQALITYRNSRVSQVHIGMLRVNTVLLTMYRQTAQGQSPGNLAPEAGFGTSPPAALLAGTSTPTSQQQGEIASALAPPVATGAGGVALPFEPQVNGQNYEDRIRQRLLDWIDSRFQQLVVGRGVAEHNDPAQVHPMARFEEIANAAKDETDQVFGSYARQPAFQGPGVHGAGNLVDRFATMQQQQGAMSPAQRTASAHTFLEWIMNADRGIRTINDEHHAVPEQNPALGLITPILNQIAADSTRCQQLLDIDRGWEGAQDPALHRVEIQLFRGANSQEDRRILWDNFQILIHEYIHSLTHQNYHTFAETRYGYGARQYNTLIEGVTSAFTEIAWTNIESRVSNQALRDRVEGTQNSQQPFDPSTVPPVSNRRYGSYDQAMGLINVVGERNVYAAYFLGETNLIDPNPPSAASTTTTGSTTTSP